MAVPFDIGRIIQSRFAQIKVYFVVEDLRRIFGAITKVNNTVLREANALPFRCANEFRFLIISNILSQTHMGGYSAYSERYKEWKEKTVGHTDFWKLFGTLMKNITVFRIPKRGYSYAWMGGITPGVSSTGGESMFKSGGGRPVLISAYGKWMEFGRKGQPARPLFGPTTKEYSANKLPAQVGKTSIFIRGSWR